MRQSGKKYLTRYTSTNLKILFVLFIVVANITYVQCTKQSTHLIIYHIFKIAFKIDVTLKTELHAGLPIEVLPSFILTFMIRGVSTILLGFSSDPFQKQ